MPRGEPVGPSWEDSPGLRELLRGKDPRAILFRLSDGDPLALFDRCIEHLRRAAALLDVRRVTTAAMARIAYYGTHYEGDPPPSVWIAEQIDEAIVECIEEDARELVDRVALEAEDPRYSTLAELLDTSPELARAGCAVFHELQEELRVAFWALIVEQRSPAEVARELKVSPAEVRRRCERAVRAISTLDPDAGEGDAPASREVRP